MVSREVAKGRESRVPPAFSSSARIDAVLGALNRNSAREIAAFYPATIDVRTALRTVSTSALAAGMKVRVVCDRRNLADAGLRAAIRDQHNSGARIRVTGTLPHYLALADNVVAVVASQGRAANEYVTMIRERAMVVGMHDHFNLTWKAATPLDAGIAEAAADVSVDELTGEIIRLLSEGLSDEDAANELGTSLRTFRRHVAGIKEMVNARSRFQAAVRLAEGGFL